MKFKKSIPYKIEIDPTPNGGFICKIGCVTLAYAGYTQLIRDLTAYFENPEDVEKQYNSDIAKLGRVHIRNVPDITVTPYVPVNTASGLSMLERNKVENQRQGGEVKYPLPSTHENKENEL